MKKKESVLPPACPLSAPCHIFSPRSPCLLKQERRKKEKTREKRGKSTGLQGKRCRVTRFGRPPTVIRAAALISPSGRPYRCGRAPNSEFYSVCPTLSRRALCPFASVPVPLPPCPPPRCRPLPSCPALLRRAFLLPLIRARAYIIKGAVPHSLDGSHPLCFFCVFMQKSRGKVWPVRDFVVPLHPLNREAPCEADEEAIFESIT